MSSRIKFIIILIVIIALAGWGEYLIPRGLDISNIQIVEVAGLDYDKNASLSLVFVPHTGNSKEGKDSKKDINEKYVIVTGDTFAETVKGIQYYEDHIFVASHLKNILLGEKLAQENLVQAIDFIGKDDNFRLNAKVYITKEMSASEVFEEGIDNNYILADRIDKLSLNKKGHRDVRTVEVVDVMQILLSDSKSGVIPCIQIIKNGEPQLANYFINTSPDEEYRVEFSGYGVISDGQLVGYLGKDESNGYDYIQNLIDEDAISLNKDGVNVGLTLTSSNSKFKFKFNNDNLKKIVIKIDTENSVLEISNGSNIFNDDISSVREAANEHIKNIVMSTIDYSKQIGVDFLNIGEKLKFKHPYKWKKISDNWDEIFKNVEVEVIVNTKIKSGYGILSLTNEG